MSQQEGAKPAWLTVPLDHLLLGIAEPVTIGANSTMADKHTSIPDQHSILRCLRLLYSSETENLLENRSTPNPHYLSS
jgi:hypothetical protein